MYTVRNLLRKLPLSSTMKASLPKLVVPPRRTRVSLLLILNRRSLAALIPLIWRKLVRFLKKMFRLRFVMRLVALARLLLWMTSALPPMRRVMFSVLRLFVGSVFMATIRLITYRRLYRLKIL